MLGAGLPALRLEHLCLKAPISWIALFNERSAKAPGAPKIDVFANIPLVAWSTPYTILGGRLEVFAITPIRAAGWCPYLSPIWLGASVK
jgi:hypothetical protein